MANETILDDMQYLVNLRPHATLLVESTSNDFNLWLVTYNADDHPFEFFLYDRSKKEAEFLFRYSFAMTLYLIKTSNYKNKLVVLDPN